MASVLPLLSETKTAPKTCSINVFERGSSPVDCLTVDTSNPSKPPNDLYIVTPTVKGEYHVLLFLHGFMIRNRSYSDLFKHISSHGFIVVCPQLYGPYSIPPTGQTEVDSAARVANWLKDNLTSTLHQKYENVEADLSKLYLSGHSRGGKMAFALALGRSQITMNILVSRLIGVDPVGGFSKSLQTDPKILTFEPQAFNLSIPVTVIGTGLGGESKNPFFPPCAPKGVSHKEFYNECKAPRFHFVTQDYGHMDMLDDVVSCLKGKTGDCVCKSGKGPKEPMRCCIGGIIVAFLMEDEREFKTILNHADCAPVTIQVEFLSEGKEALSYACV